MEEEYRQHFFVSQNTTTSGWQKLSKIINYKRRSTGCRKMLMSIVFNHEPHRQSGKWTAGTWKSPTCKGNHLNQTFIFWIPEPTSPGTPRACPSFFSKVADWLTGHSNSAWLDSHCDQPSGIFSAQVLVFAVAGWVVRDWSKHHPNTDRCTFCLAFVGWYDWYERRSVDPQSCCSCWRSVDQEQLCCSLQDRYSNIGGQTKTSLECENRSPPISSQTATNGKCEWFPADNPDNTVHVERHERSVPRRIPFFGPARRPLMWPCVRKDLGFLVSSDSDPSTFPHGPSSCCSKNLVASICAKADNSHSSTNLIFCHGRIININMQPHWFSKWMHIKQQNKINKPRCCNPSGAARTAIPQCSTKIDSSSILKILCSSTPNLAAPDQHSIAAPDVVFQPRKAQTKTKKTRWMNQKCHVLYI